MVAYSSCRRVGPARGGGKVRRKGPGRGKKRGKAKKILNRGNEPKDLLQAKELAVFSAKNELVFQCKRTQFEPKNGAKKPLLTRNRSQDSRVGRCGGWASTRGLHELRIRPLRAMEILPAQSLADCGKELRGFFLRQNGVLRMTRDPRLRYSRKVESQESTVEESKTFRPLTRLCREVDTSPEGGFGPQGESRRSRS